MSEQAREAERRLTREAQPTEDACPNCERLTQERDRWKSTCHSDAGKMFEAMEARDVAEAAFRQAKEQWRRDVAKAHRQLAAVVEALVRTGKWARLPDGYLMCRVCCTGMRCECEPGKHVP